MLPRVKSNVSDSDATPLQSIFSITNTIEVRKSASSTTAVLLRHLHLTLSLRVQINPKNMEEGQDDSIGRLQLELILQKLLSRIIDSLPYFPLYVHPCPPPLCSSPSNRQLSFARVRYLRQLCHMLYEDMRYDHPDYVHRVLGNLIFLRFIVCLFATPLHFTCSEVLTVGGATVRSVRR
jgi:hypothetical protein